MCAWSSFAEFYVTMCVIVLCCVLCCTYALYINRNQNHEVYIDRVNNKVKSQIETYIVAIFFY
jgi:hypothetical protein